jgi:rhamnose transport system ATP-binding protein
MPMNSMGTASLPEYRRSCDIAANYRVLDRSSTKQAIETVPKPAIAVQTPVPAISRDGVLCLLFASPPPLLRSPTGRGYMRHSDVRRAPANEMGRWSPAMSEDAMERAPATAHPDGVQPVFEAERISKSFGGTQALSDVSLTLYPGEIHALLGENGAGKSTLIKIMTGLQQPDSGDLRIDGEQVRINSSQDAQRLGVAAIYQEPMIFPDLSVAENIFIGHTDRGQIVDRRRMERDARTTLERLGVSLDVDEPARGLTLAEQQTVEIAKAISLDVRVLIMDEPTASLSAHEVRQLFRIVMNLRQQGVAVCFISHRMEEVFEIADRVTILRDGRWISTQPRAEVTPASAIRGMVGREVVELFKRNRHDPGPVRLSVKNLRRDGVFDDISFDLRAGEVLGFAGLVGARRTDVGLALFGIAPADGGEIELEGAPVTITSPRQAMGLGIAYSTEDRRQLGLVLPMSIAENISLPSLPKFLTGAGFVKRDEEISMAERFRERLAIRSPSVATPAGQLSGGNQQKVLISKWLETSPKVLIVDEPTRGIDVGAKIEVHQLIDDLAAEGMAIIIISSDLPEVLAMSDRILVMREGRQMAIFPHEEATQERVLSAAMGQEGDLFPDGSAAAEASAVIDRLIAGEAPGGNA